MAGARWRSRYCLELGQCTMFGNLCDCSGCPQGCDDCNTAGDYCCREFEFDWCVRGPIFRYPPGIGNYVQNDPTCPPAGAFAGYTLCPDPWEAPDFDLTERGYTTEYESTNQGSCTVCTAAGANNRVQYRCKFRLETVAGNDCTYQVDGVTYDCEDWDETYTVEGRAYIRCIEAGTDGGCSETEPYTHELWIVPCGSPAAGLPSPPSMRWLADLDKNTAPQDTAVWVLDQVTFNYVTPDNCSGFALPITPAHAWCTNGTPCATYSNPCSDNAQQGCDGCGGLELSMGTFSVLDSYPCQDNPCTLT